MARRGSKLGTSVLDLDVDDSKFESKLNAKRRWTQRWTDGIGKDVKKGLAQGLGIGAGVGVAMAVSQAVQGVQAVVAGSISAAIEWESAFAGVRKTVDASEEEFAALEDGIRGMAREIPIAATELAGLAEAAGALGIAKADILEFTRVTALIGTTTDVSADQAATSLGQLSNVLGLTSDDYERFGSTLVDLGNKGASTESQILEIASRAGAGSKLIGMASQETLAWASSVANLGIEVEAGGSSLQTFFLRTAKMVADGSDKLDTLARVAGVTAAEFKRAFEQDATGALQQFLAGLGQLSQGEQLRALSDLDFKDVRITRTLLGLAGNVDNLSNSLTVANEAWEENSALANEAAKRFDTTESKLVVLGNRVNDLAITFGDALLPALVDIATFGVEQLEAFVSELVSFVDSIADTARWTQIYFGEIGATIEDRAHEIGRDVGEMKDLVLFAMNELGMGVDDAMAYAERRLAGLGPTMSDAAMESLEAFRAIEHGMVDPVEAGVEGVEGALIAGQAPIDEAAEAAMSQIDKEAEEARKASVEAMRGMLEDLTGLFESDTSVRDAWQALIDRMDDPYTEAERKADIFSQQTIENIRAAIQTGDPKVVADTAELVSGMLAQIETLEPGALAAGTAVPPALQEGMDAQVGALITWIEQNVTRESLASMSLAEAEELGLEGMFLYAQGMRRNRAQAVAEARNAAIMTSEAFGEPDYFGAGRDAMIAFGSGLSAGQAIALNHARMAADAIRDIFPSSEPKDPRSPLRGITDAFGFVDVLAHGIAPNAALRGAVAGVASAMVPNLGPDVARLPEPRVARLAGVSSMGSELASGGTSIGGARTIENHYHLHVDGKEVKVGNQDDVLEAWSLQRRFNDRSVIRNR